MKKLILLSVYLVIPAFAQEVPRERHRLWNWSFVALAGANAADIGTSLGRHELNPLLAGSNGMLDTGRAIEIKGALVGGLVLTEWLFHRRHPEMAKPFAFVNFATAGALGAVAAHNSSLPK
jgi:hypothetical protein